VKPRKGQPPPTQLEIALEESARRSKMLVAQWYLRISGQVPWRPGEKEVLDSQIEAENGKWNLIQGRIELSMGAQ
jgi:hypothetical protein